MLTLRALPALTAALWLLSLAPACGDDAEQGPPCEEPTDCEQLLCPDGSRFRVCIEGRCLTDPAEVCEESSSTGGAR